MSPKPDFLIPPKAPATPRDPLDHAVYAALYAVFLSRGMAGVVAVCHDAQKQIALRNRIEMVRTGWIV